MNKSIKNLLIKVGLPFLLLAIIACDDDPGIIQYPTFPGYVNGTVNGKSFEYEISGSGRGTEYSYSTSFRSSSQSQETFNDQSLTVRFFTDLCLQNDCEWRPIPSDSLLETISNLEWTLSNDGDIGVSLIYLDEEVLYYSDFNVESSPDNFFILDTAYIDEFDLKADFREPFEKIVVVEGRFYSTLSNIEDHSDQIKLEGAFKGFLDSESEW